MTHLSSLKRAWGRHFTPTQTVMGQTDLWCCSQYLKDGWLVDWLLIYLLIWFVGVGHPQNVPSLLETCLNNILPSNSQTKKEFYPGSCFIQLPHPGSLCENFSDNWKVHLGMEEHGFGFFTHLISPRSWPGTLLPIIPASASPVRGQRCVLPYPAFPKLLETVWIRFMS